MLGPWAGSLADRQDKRRLLIAVQVLAAGQAGVLAALVLAGALTVPLLYLLALAYGLLYAVENPTRRAFVAGTVDPPDISNAASLNSTVAAGARVVGPASDRSPRCTRRGPGNPTTTSPPTCCATCSSAGSSPTLTRA